MLLPLLLFCCVNALNITDELSTKTFLNGSFYSVPFPFGLVLKQYIFEESDPLSMEPFVQVAGLTGAAPIGPPPDPSLETISVVGRPADKPAADKQVSRQETVAVSCATENLLVLVLQESELRNVAGGVASVDREHMFQFDSKVAQPSGWSVNAYGELALYGSTLFYQCRSGNSYKIFDAPVSSRCMPVSLEVVEVVACT